MMTTPPLVLAVKETLRGLAAQEQRGEKEIAYLAAVLACTFARALLREHDLGEMLEAIGHAEGVGPILDPTLYRERGKAMEEDRDLMRAALMLRNFEPRGGR